MMSASNDKGHRQSFSSWTDYALIISPIILGTVGFLIYHFLNVNQVLLENTYAHVSKVTWLQDKSFCFLFGIGGIFLFELVCGLRLLRSIERLDKFERP